MKSIIRRILRESYVGRAEEDVEIRINVNNTIHADERATLRDFDENEILGIVEAGIEKLTIDLMHDVVDIDQVIVMKSGDLNVICKLNPGDMYFTLDVITLIRDHHYRARPNQYILDVDRGTSMKQPKRTRIRR